MRASLVAALAGLAVTAGLVLTGNNPATADVDSVSGNAYGGQINSALLGQILPPTPFVEGEATEPEDGFGPFIEEAPVDLNLDIVNVFAAILRAGTEGAGLNDPPPADHLAFAESFGEAANVQLGPDLAPVLTADLIRAECHSDGNGSTATTTIVDLTGVGDLITSEPDPVVIEIPATTPLLRLTINERFNVTNVPGVQTTIGVRALHIELLPAGALLFPAGLDIIIGEAQCAAAGPDVLLETTTTTGTVPPTTGTVPPTTGTVPPTTGTVPPTTGTVPPTTGTVPPTTGTVPPTTGTVPPTTGTTAPPIVTTAPIITGGQRGGGQVPGGTLARTGNNNVSRVITLAFLALVLGGLFVLGSRGVTGNAVQSRARRRRGRGLL